MKCCNLKDKTINIHTGIRIVKKQICIVDRKENSSDQLLGSILYLENMEGFSIVLVGDRPMKLMAMILPRSGG